MSLDVPGEVWLWLGAVVMVALGMWDYRNWRDR